MHLHIHHHADQRVADRLDLIQATLEILMDNVDRLIDDIAKQKTVIDSLTAFITGLKGQVADALAGAKLSADHEARLAAIFPGLEANTAAIADAVTANTPAAPDPAPAAAPAPDVAPPAAPASPASDVAGAPPASDPAAPTT